MFTTATAVACVRYTKCFQVLSEMTDGAETTDQIFHAYETAFSMSALPAMVHAERSLTAHVPSDAGKGKVSTIVLISGAGKVIILAEGI